MTIIFSLLAKTAGLVKPMQPTEPIFSTPTLLTGALLETLAEPAG